ncbi:hypothetical protein [Sphingobacterium corticibacter]|uniref:Uncharacterized protein n=1 Tax=Sphingobacterium corticibacter TaxID=2171749 RepID=A0A2T8HNF5_9SPHI|nr:hypothetical protein [Sphingobacterium corticibacter]PVH26940.1 hypothetical protein DC487_04920 [Sphingobacterium corticibacter]
MLGLVGHVITVNQRTGSFKIRAKSGVDGERVLKDTRFVRTRENGYEFGRASRKGKQIRMQLRHVFRGIADSTMKNRLVSLLHHIQKNDRVNTRGARMLLPENAAMLRGFEFNKNSSLSLIFTEKLDIQYDRDSGLAKLLIPAFNPQNASYLPKVATYISFSFAAAPLPITEERWPSAISTETDFITLVGIYEGAELHLQLPPSSPDVIYFLVDISAYKQINKDYTPLQDGKRNALTIIKVDVPDQVG